MNDTGYLTPVKSYEHHRLRTVLQHTRASIGIKILVTLHVQSTLFLSNFPVVPTASLSVTVRECDVCRRSGGDHDHYFYDSCVGDVVIVSVVL
jgi:hypothetical protein